MQLFKVLIKNGEEYFVYALNKTDALSQFDDVHIMDLRQVDNFVDSLNDMTSKPREYYKEQSLIEEEREENIRDLYRAYNHMRKLLDKYESIIKVQEKELLDKK